MDLQFDAIYEQTCLCAIEPEARVRYEAKLLELLKPEGLLFALFMQTGNPGEGPPFHCDVQDMKKLFDQNRWNWPSDEGIRYDHPAGGIYEMAFVLAKK